MLRATLLYMVGKAELSTDKLTAGLGLLITDAGYFLEEVSVLRSGKYVTLRVIVDLCAGTEVISSDELDQLTGKISTYLDEHDPFTAPYVLEVSSPGAERKLKTLRHYQRALGRIAELKLNSGEKLTARITAVTDAYLTVVPVTKVPKSNKIILGAAIDIKFEEIKRARQQVELGQLVEVLGQEE